MCEEKSTHIVVQHFCEKPLVKANSVRIRKDKRCNSTDHFADAKKDVIMDSMSKNYTFVNGFMDDLLLFILVDSTSRTQHNYFE